MKSLKVSAAAALLLLAPLAQAAGPFEGVKTASEAAEFRAPGSKLVEIEGFTDPEGDIPCSGKSFSNSWHYKFHSASTGGWLIVNACGENFINAATHFPSARSEEPVRTLPASFAGAAAVLKKLQKDGVFQAAPASSDREILMAVRYMPAKSGRPAGCYWTVSREKQKVLADCQGKEHWTTGAAPGAKLAPSTAPKGKDTAGKYTKLALETMQHKHPGARLMYVESLVDRTGSTKCLSAMEGWDFVFSSPGAASNMTLSACLGKTSLEEVDFTGRTAGTNRLDPMPLQFKDSDFALSKVPSCAQDYATSSMRLQNFKPRFTPFAGHNFIWTVDCGSHKYYADGYTGQYLGPGRK